MNYKLLLWDFDGTLADTLSIALGIYNRMAAKRSFRPISDPDAVRGMGIREFLKTHNVAARHVPFAFNTFLRELRRLAPEVRLNTGIARTVREAAGRGVAQGIVSSNDTQTIQACLDANHIADVFDYVSGTSRIFGKERRIRKAMSQCGVRPPDVLYIGDEVRDIEAARAAGLDIASVTWGLNSEELLRSEQPTFVVDHPEEILDILQPETC
ncbi:MAG: HAD-IA family hydrolase [Planctomycetaceae bacterium]|nr:HAD-IA family hydrolase [Planctomycetaceae bacterium]